jgi:hypothetical protein
LCATVAWRIGTNILKLVKSEIGEFVDSLSPTNRECPKSFVGIWIEVIKSLCGNHGRCTWLVEPIPFEWVGLAVAAYTEERSSL